MHRSIRSPHWPKAIGATGAALFWAAPALAEMRLETKSMAGPIMGGLLFVVGLAAIIFVFYRLVYGLLVNFYHPEICQQIVLSMMFLWICAWLGFSVYALFGLEHPWVLWALVFLSGLWLVSFLVVLIRVRHSS